MKGLLNQKEGEPLFVSHAKLDGDDTATAIVDFVNSRNNDVPLRTFYDAKELSPGDDFAEEFKEAINSGTLLAIVSDAYDSRPWCVFELTEAKRAKRPIVLADVGRVRISRTYPYGANVPKVKINPVTGETAWIEPLLVECLSEGLRCDLFNLEVSGRLGKPDDDVLVLPRPPELFDLIDSSLPPSRAIYPDPPLSKLEAELIDKALKRLGNGAAKLQTLSDFMSNLENLRIQISLSSPPDHLKLAIPSREIDRAMLAVCMAVVRAGATIVYGGDLRPGGFTFKIFRHLARAYAASGSVPFEHIISYPSLERMTYDLLADALKERRGTCRTFVCVEENLLSVRPGDDIVVIGDAVELYDQESFSRWLEGLRHLDPPEESSAAREVVANYIHACISIGGKMGRLDVAGDQYIGKMPGLIEEALLALNKGKPIVPLAAYGGAARDLAISLQLLDGKRVPRGEQSQSYDIALAEAAASKDRIPSSVLAKLQAIARDDRTEIVARDTVEIIQMWRQAA
ncbi:TIR domain-containing protein [Rhizobium leguminosarum]|uniref:TIR domain-containing protein n=1 Tax=Rhizobium leguminosarum TaxID=384 RepID=UPI00056AF798|nr:TIR domain-containing protein [Rhizobium leguminosarum]